MCVCVCIYIYIYTHIRVVCCMYIYNRPQALDLLQKSLSLLCIYYTTDHKHWTGC